MAAQFTELSYVGSVVACRPKLKNGGIPDLLILDLPRPIAKEIMITEKDSRFDAKDYMGIRKIKVRCKK